MLSSANASADTAVAGALPPEAASAGPVIQQSQARLSVVTVVGEDANASQVGPNRGLFTFTRSAKDKSASAVSIHYTLGGTARNGKDYQRLSGVATIEAGHTWVSIPVTPIAGSFAKGTRSVVLTIWPDSGYTVGSRKSASITISAAATPDAKSQPATNPAPRPLPTWPQAPFSDSEHRATIYVNPFGDAVLSGESFHGSAFNGYDVFFDDTGTMTFETTGTTHTQVAFYGTGSTPTVVNDGSDNGGNGKIQVPVTTKTLVHVGVRAANGKPGGSYGIVIHGVPSTYVLDVPIDPTRNAGQSRTFISNTHDIDYFKFTTTRAGTWHVTLHPVKPKPDAMHMLNPTLVIFDAQGLPIAGSFIQPIGGNGPGQDVTATLKLPANAVGYLRIGAVGEDIGQTSILVRRQPMPAVSITAKTSTIPASGATPAQFIVRRSARTGTGKALPVSYTVSGTAANGADYQTLSGKVIIPAHQQTAVIDLVRTAGAEGLAGKNVVLTLAAGTKYDLSGRFSASISFV